MQDKEREAAVLFVAQALGLRDDHPVRWDDLKPRLKEIYLSDAKSAIEAYEYWCSMNRSRLWRMSRRAGP